MSLRLNSLQAYRRCALAIIFNFIMFISYSASATNSLICNRDAEQIAAKNLQILMSNLDLIIDNQKPISMHSPISVVMIGANAEELDAYFKIFNEINSKSIMNVKFLTPSAAVASDLSSLFILYFFDGHLVGGIEKNRAILADKLCLTNLGLGVSDCAYLAKVALREKIFSENPGESDINYGVNVFGSNKRRVFRLQMNARKSKFISERFIASNTLDMFGIRHLFEYQDSIYVNKNADKMTDADRIMLGVLTLSGSNGEVLSPDNVLDGIRQYEKMCGW